MNPDTDNVIFLRFSLIRTTVVVCGAAGGIGQPLSLLLKQSDLITDLALYDVVNAPGVAADLSHINTKSTVTGHGKEDMDAALKGAHTVIIPAGVPRKPGMTRDDLFKVYRQRVNLFLHDLGSVKGQAAALAEGTHEN
jgi:malate/lactate dehydrogenase